MRVKVKQAARRDGVEKLRQTADRMLDRKAKELGELLWKKVQEEKLEWLKVMVGLAAKKMPPPPQEEELGRPILTLRERLAMEPRLPNDTPIPDWDAGEDEAHDED